MAGASATCTPVTVFVAVQICIPMLIKALFVLSFVHLQCDELLRPIFVQEVHEHAQERSLHRRQQQMPDDQVQSHWPVKKITTGAGTTVNNTS